MPDKSHEELRIAAFVAARAGFELADELDEIIDGSLPANASRALRVHLRRLAVRQRDVADALARELDDPSPDPELVGHLTRALRRAAELFLAGVVFASGTIATGALEDLGADLKSSLAQRVAAVDGAAADVEAMLRADRIATPTSPSRLPPALLSAVESGDGRAVNRELEYLVELEDLLREATVAATRRAYGRDWDAGLSERRDDTAFSRAPGALSFQDLIALVGQLERDGHLPENLRSWAADGRAALKLLPIRELRNAHAHGQVTQPQWLVRFLATDGKDVLVDSLDLHTRLSRAAS